MRANVFYKYLLFSLLNRTRNEWKRLANDGSNIYQSNTSIIEKLYYFSN